MSGLTFVITGILEYIEREECVELIKRHGGKVTTSISGKTSYVVLGREAGPAKMEKIKKLKIKTVDDEGLFKMIEENPLSGDEDVGDNSFVQDVEMKDESQPNEPEFATKSVEERLVKEEAVLMTTQGDVVNNTSSLTTLGSVVKEEAKDLRTKKQEQKNITQNTELWVEKYRPSSLKNLMGQFGPSSPANKLLKWLKNWDASINGKTKNRDDGSAFKAALLSGQPGVGKTTAAILCCKELNLDYVELNASDTRNKSLLKNTIEESSSNQSFRRFFKKAEGAKDEDSGKKFHVIIMDEVDGISGNADRGGLVELVNIIKKSTVPIVCICNDRMNQKIRTLANYCFDLRFQRPRVDQIRGYCSTIVCRENMSIQPQALTELILGSDQDIRQVINRLQMLAITKQKFKSEEMEKVNQILYKDSTQNVFESIRKLMSYSEAPKLSVNQKMDLFFVDYSFTPLFMQENYHMCTPAAAGGNHTKTMKIYAEMCDLFALSTVSEKIIRSSQAWSLLPIQGLFSCVIPSSIGNGTISSMINFPQWLGKNSTTGKNGRYLDQLNLHTHISTMTNRQNILLDYVPYIHQFIHSSLTDPECIEDGSLQNSVDFMRDYNLTREDWDLICELQLYDNLQKSSSAKIPSKVPIFVLFLLV